MSNFVEPISDIPFDNSLKHADTPESFSPFIFSNFCIPFDVLVKSGSFISCIFFILSPRIDIPLENFCNPFVSTLESDFVIELTLMSTLPRVFDK